MRAGEAEFRHQLPIVSHLPGVSRAGRELKDSASDPSRIGPAGPSEAQIPGTVHPGGPPSALQAPLGTSAHTIRQRPGPPRAPGGVGLRESGGPGVP